MGTKWEESIRNMLWRVCCETYGWHVYTEIVVVECTRLMQQGTNVGLREMWVLSCVLMMHMCIGRCDCDEMLCSQSLC